MLKEVNAKLLNELDKLKERGVRITLEGIEENPTIVVNKLCINEESNYMRDYILDNNGKLIELGFYSVKQD